MDIMKQVCVQNKYEDSHGLSRLRWKNGFVIVFIFYLKDFFFTCIFFYQLQFGLASLI